MIKPHITGSEFPLGNEQRVQWGMVQHEYGNGLYFTPDLKLAIEYSGRGGLVQVVDWTGKAEGLKLKYFQRKEDGWLEWGNL